MIQHFIKLRRPYRSRIDIVVARLRSAGYTADALAVGGIIDVRGTLSPAQLRELHAMEEVETVLERPGEDRVNTATGEPYT